MGGFPILSAMLFVLAAGSIACLFAEAKVARAIALQQQSVGSDPWSRRDGWRLHGASVQRFDLEWQGQSLEVLLTSEHGGGAVLKVGDIEVAFASRALGGDRHDVVLGTGQATRRVSLTVYQTGEQVSVFAASGSAQATVVDTLAHAGEGHKEAGRLTAPMPGKVIQIFVKAGDKVKRGAPLAVLEAMKMENTLSAQADATIAEIAVSVGDQVGEGALILRFEAGPAK